jgi:hypothetical protein
MTDSLAHAGRPSGRLFWPVRATSPGVLAGGRAAEG